MAEKTNTPPDDAPLSEVEPAEVEAQEQDSPTDQEDAPQQDADAPDTEAVIPEVVDEAEVIEAQAETAEAADHPDESTADQHDAEPENDPAPIEPEPAAAPPAPAPVQKAPIGPMILAGAVCAVLGFGAAVLTQQNSPLWPQDTQTADALAVQAKTLAALEAQVQELAARPVGDVMQADLQALRDDLTVLPALDSAITGVSARLDALEQSTIEAAIPDELVAKYRAEVESISQLLESQRGELAGFMQDAKAKADEAAEIARNTVAVGALDRISTALATGVGFEQTLQELEQALGDAAPVALRDVAVDGVETVSELSQEFADVARQALAAARVEMDQGQGLAKVSNFLKNQFNARSVVPKDGDDPDAVLSRAEQALRDGNLGAVMAELEKLNPAALDPMSQWSEALKKLAEAQAAVDALNAQLKN